MLDVELTKKQNSNSEKNVYCLKKKNKKNDRHDFRSLEKAVIVKSFVRHIRSSLI